MLNNIGYKEFSPPKNTSNCNQLDNDQCISNSKCKLITTASGNKKCRKLNASSNSSSNKTQKSNKVFFETPLKQKSKKQQYDFEKQKLEFERQQLEFEKEKYQLEAILKKKSDAILKFKTELKNTKKQIASTAGLDSKIQTNITHLNDQTEQIEKLREELSQANKVISEQKKNELRRKELSIEKLEKAVTFQIEQRSAMFNSVSKDINDKEEELRETINKLKQEHAQQIQKLMKFGKINGDKLNAILNEDNKTVQNSELDELFNEAENEKELIKTKQIFIKTKFLKNAEINTIKQTQKQQRNRINKLRRTQKLLFNKIEDENNVNPQDYENVESLNEQLPFGWKKVRDYNGKYLYINLDENIIQDDPPSIEKKEKLHKNREINYQLQARNLPKGWEMKIDKNGVPYYKYIHYDPKNPLSRANEKVLKQRTRPLKSPVTMETDIPGRKLNTRSYNSARHKHSQKNWLGYKIPENKALMYSVTKKKGWEKKIDLKGRHYYKYRDDDPIVMESLKKRAKILQWSRPEKSPMKIGAIPPPKKTKGDYPEKIIDTAKFENYAQDFENAFTNWEVHRDNKNNVFYVYKNSAGAITHKTWHRPKTNFAEKLPNHINFSAEYDVSSNDNYTRNLPPGWIKIFNTNGQTFYRYIRYIPENAVDIKYIKENPDDKYEVPYYRFLIDKKLPQFQLNIGFPTYSVVSGDVHDAGINNYSILKLSKENKSKLNTQYFYFEKMNNKNNCGLGVDYLTNIDYLDEESNVQKTDVQGYPYLTLTPDQLQFNPFSFFNKNKYKYKYCTVPDEQAEIKRIKDAARSQLDGIKAQHAYLYRIDKPTLAQADAYKKELKDIEVNAKKEISALNKYYYECYKPKNYITIFDKVIKPTPYNVNGNTTKNKYTYYGYRNPAYLGANTYTEGYLSHRMIDGIPYFSYFNPNTYYLDYALEQENVPTNVIPLKPGYFNFKITGTPAWKRPWPYKRKFFEHMKLSQLTLDFMEEVKTYIPSGWSPGVDIWNNLYYSGIINGKLVHTYNVPTKDAEVYKDRYEKIVSNPISLKNNPFRQLSDVLLFWDKEFDDKLIEDNGWKKICRIGDPFCKNPWGWKNAAGFVHTRDQRSDLLTKLYRQHKIPIQNLKAAVQERELLKPGWIRFFDIINYPYYFNVNTREVTYILRDNMIAKTKSERENKLKEIGVPIKSYELNTPIDNAHVPLPPGWTLEHNTFVNDRSKTVTYYYNEAKSISLDINPLEMSTVELTVLEDQLKALPRGWVEKYDPKSKTFVYKNMRSDVVTFFAPKIIPDSQIAARLANWLELNSECNGKLFYFNKLKKVTTDIDPEIFIYIEDYYNENEPLPKYWVERVNDDKKYYENLNTCKKVNTLEELYKLENAAKVAATKVAAPMTGFAPWGMAPPVGTFVPGPGGGAMFGPAPIPSAPPAPSAFP
jgi:uncharacterized protein (DUF736 family)